MQWSSPSSQYWLLVRYYFFVSWCFLTKIFQFYYFLHFQFFLLSVRAIYYCCLFKLMVNLFVALFIYPWTLPVIIQLTLSLWTCLVTLLVANRIGILVCFLFDVIINFCFTVLICLFPILNQLEPQVVCCFSVFYQVHQMYKISTWLQDRFQEPLLGSHVHVLVRNSILLLPSQLLALKVQKSIFNLAYLLVRSFRLFRCL